MALIGEMPHNQIRIYWSTNCINPRYNFFSFLSSWKPFLRRFGKHRSRIVAYPEISLLVLCPVYGNSNNGCYSSNSNSHSNPLIETTLIPNKEKQASFIHSFNYFYSASSSPLLLRSASATARILCRNFTPKSNRWLWVKDLPKVPTWRLERESNPWPFGRKALTLPKRHHAPQTTPHIVFVICNHSLHFSTIVRV